MLQVGVKFVENPIQVDGECGQTLKDADGFISQEGRTRIFITRRTRLDIYRRVTTTTAGSNKFGEGDRLVRERVTREVFVVEEGGRSVLSKNSDARSSCCGRRWLIAIVQETTEAYLLELSLFFVFYLFLLFYYFFIL